MAEADKVGLTKLGQRLQDLNIKLYNLNGPGDGCLACHCEPTELMALLESDGLDPREVEAEAQKIAYDFILVPRDEYEHRGKLSSVSGRCGDAAYLPFFLAACYAVMSRQE